MTIYVLLMLIDTIRDYGFKGRFEYKSLFGFFVVAIVCDLLTYATIRFIFR